MDRAAIKDKVPRVIIILGIGAFINAVGNSLIWPLNSLFIHNVLGKSLTEAGFVIAFQSGLSLAGQFFSGYIADRFGARRLMIIGLLLASGTVGTIGAFPIWPVYAPAIILLGLTQALIFVPLNALISILWPEGERRGFNYLYVAVNAGVAVGTALGGLLAQISFRLVFMSNAATFLLYLTVVLLFIPKDIRAVTRQSKAKLKGISLRKDWGFRALCTLCLGIFLVWSAYVQLTTILPVIMSQRGFSLALYSVLWTLNGIFIVTLQPLISWAIRTVAYTFPRQFLLGGGLMGIAFMLLLRPMSYPWYIAIMLLLTLGEMFIFPAVPTVAARLAPKGREGTYQGAVAGMASGGRMLGPLLGGLSFDRWGGETVWYLALGFILTALLAFNYYRLQVKQLDTDQLNLGV